MRPVVTVERLLFEGRCHGGVEVEPGRGVLECAHHREEHTPRDRDHVVQYDGGRGVHQQHSEGEALQDADQLHGEEVTDVGCPDVPSACAIHERHAGKVAEGCEAEGDDHGEQTDQGHGDELRDGDADPARLEGEGDQARALAPLGGDREDAEHRKQDALRGCRRADEVQERQLVRIGDEQEHDDDGDRDETDGGEQPEAGPGIDELAQFDPQQPTEGYGRDAGIW